MVKDHSDSERGNPLMPLHGLSLSISSKGYVICISYRHDSMAFVIPIVVQWLKQEIAQLVYNEESIQ